MAGIWKISEDDFFARSKRDLDIEKATSAMDAAL